MLSSRRRNRNISELLQKSIEDKDYYNALQYYKTLLSKFIVGKEYEKAEQMYEDGIKLFCLNNEVTSAYELANNYLQMLKDRHVELDEDHVSQLVRLINFFPQSDYKVQISKTYAIWAREVSTVPGGNKDLNKEAGLALWSINFAYDEANNYLLYCQDCEIYGDFLIDWCEQGYKNEQDLYITRSILILLSLGNIKFAGEVYRYLQKKKPIDTPLSHFCEYLLYTVERDAYPLFKLLTEKYQKGLNRDPSFSSLLGQIAKRYYNIQPISNNPFQDMFKMFMKQ
ncbi:hypothetical protein WA158_008042 [Blastocystis sp. Blastoise]